MPFWSKDASKPRGSSLSPDELISLAKRYVVQETVGPLKKIAKVLGVGLGGAIVTGIGGVIVLLGVLRLLQTETGEVFSGNWTFAPYLLTAVVGVALAIVVGLAFMSALKVPPAHDETTTE